MLSTPDTTLHTPSTFGAHFLGVRGDNAMDFKLRRAPSIDAATVLIRAACSQHQVHQAKWGGIQRWEMDRDRMLFDHLGFAHNSVFRWKVNHDGALTSREND
jgi:hypothetical protein